MRESSKRRSYFPVSCNRHVYSAVGPSEHEMQADEEATAQRAEDSNRITELTKKMETMQQQVKN